MNIILIILRVIFFIFFPSFLIYLGSEVSLINILKKDKILGENFNIVLVKQICLISSVFITSIILVFLHEYKNYKLQLMNNKNLSLSNDLKMSFLSAIAMQLKDDRLNQLNLEYGKNKKD